MISRIAKLNLLVLAACIFSLAGCGKRNVSDEPEPVMNDPESDFAKLQGTWKRVLSGEGSPESYLVFEGDLMIYDHFEIRLKGMKPDFDKFRFVLDSTRMPKRLTIIEEETAGKWVDVPIRTGGYAKRYKLEGDTLTLWTQWLESFGEQSYDVYKRVKKA